MTTFGKDIMKKEFFLDPGSTFLNHGSFGTAPRPVLDHRIQLINTMEQMPDLWIRSTSGPLWEANVNAASEFVGADPNNLVLVGNATTGLNAVIRSVAMDLQKGDGILLHSWTYPSVLNTSHYMADCKGLELLFVNIKVPLESVQRLLDSYEDMLKKHVNIRFVILDYITCCPSVMMPLHDLVALCRRYGKLILVDGAHSPGQCQLSLEQLGVDFFVGDLHKWCFAPRGCAFLWIQPSFHDKIFPAVMASYKGNIHGEFSYNGTQDTTQLCSVGEAINFYNKIGGFEVISDYCTSLVTKGVELLIQRWGTEQLPVPVEMRSPYMRLVLLPKGGKENNYDYQKNLGLAWTKYKVDASWASVPDDPRVWVRLSAMVYNELGDYQRLADVIFEMMSDETESSSDAGSVPPRSSWLTLLP